ncbi:unnamed protein product [Oikopleura dioica]|uniref:SH3 domain-containing protein n=1 Tax=Oikopleura dioica TaxID=34765 RepID=E4XCU6_OIKDI|nr:unnamed protein product [Oikopleura dioica]
MCGIMSYIVTPNLPEQINALQIAPKSAPPARPKPRVAAKPRTYPKARVIYDYNAQDNDELTLREQNIVDVISEDPSGWWRVSFQGKSGLFPGSYVEKI